MLVPTVADRFIPNTRRKTFGPRLGRRCLAALGAAAFTTLALASLPAEAQAGDEKERVACLDAHERSQVLRLEGKLLEARASMRVCSRDLCPAAIRSDCTDWLEQVQLQVPSVVFEASTKRGDETEVKVFSGDRMLTEKLDGEAIELDPGVYDFRFEHALEKPLKMRVVIRAGEKNRVIAVEFKPPETGGPGGGGTTTIIRETGPRKETYRPLTLPTFLFGGLALASAGAATYFGITALSDYNNADDECAPGCSDDRVNPVKTKALITDIAIGGAVAFTAAAVVFTLIRPTRERTPEGATAPAESTKPEIGFLAGEDGGLLEIRGRF